jgi:hypothetical protein
MTKIQEHLQSVRRCNSKSKFDQQFLENGNQKAATDVMKILHRCERGPHMNTTEISMFVEKGKKGQSVK